MHVTLQKLFMKKEKKKRLLKKWTRVQENKTKIRDDE
jgi:hypothetical protein